MTMIFDKLDVDNFKIDDTKFNEFLKEQGITKDEFLKLEFLAKFMINTYYFDNEYQDYVENHDIDTYNYKSSVHMDEYANETVDAQIKIIDFIRSGYKTQFGYEPTRLQMIQSMSNLFAAVHGSKAPYKARAVHFELKIENAQERQPDGSYKKIAPYTVNIPFVRIYDIGNIQNEAFSDQDFLDNFRVFGVLKAINENPDQLIGLTCDFANEDDGKFMSVPLKDIDEVIKNDPEKLALYDLSSRMFDGLVFFEGRDETQYDQSNDVEHADLEFSDEDPDKHGVDYTVKMNVKDDKTGETKRVEMFTELLFGPFDDPSELDGARAASIKITSID